jgi:hypothetical protein
MEDVLRQNLDWSAVKTISGQLGAQPLLYRHLSQEKYARSVPDEVMRFLKDQYRRQSMGNLRIYGQVHQILDSMRQSNLPVVLLKGAFLAKWIYRDIAIRPMTDIDILCRKEDKQIVQNKLIELGYQQRLIYPSPFHEDLSAVTAHLSPFYRPRSVQIEVHFSVFPEIPHDPMDMEKVWETTVPAELDGIQINSLSPEYQLLHLSLHLFYHLTSHPGVIPFYWFCDVHEVIKVYHDKIDWSQFPAGADSLEVGTQMRSLFGLLRTNWGTPIPQEVLSHPDTGIRPLCLRTIIRNQFTDKARKRNQLQNYIKAIKFATTIKGRGNRFYYLWRLIFPTRAYLIDQYHPRNPLMVYLYHIIHPYKICRRIMVTLFHNVT